LLRHHPSLEDLALVGGMFPVQSTPAITAGAGRRLIDRLGADGVRAVLRQTCGGGSAATLVVTATHAASDIDRAARSLGGAWQDFQVGLRRAA